MALQLKAEEQALLLEEVTAFGADLPEGEARQRFEQLTAAVEEGMLPDEVLDTLGVLLEVGLQSGYVRHIHRAATEQKLLRLFGQTPAGKARANAVDDVNKALAQLEGQTIESARVYGRLPGQYILLLSTDTCEISLRFAPDGAGVESVAVGL